MENPNQKSDRSLNGLAAVVFGVLWIGVAAAIRFCEGILNDGYAVMPIPVLLLVAAVATVAIIHVAHTEDVSLIKAAGIVFIIFVFFAAAMSGGGGDTGRW
jgi:hypothetical protein